MENRGAHKTKHKTRYRNKVCQRFEFLSGQRTGLREIAKAFDNRSRSLRWSNAANERDRKSTRLNSSHVAISYAVFCLKKKIKNDKNNIRIERIKTHIVHNNIIIFPT